jgi:hypothetical protein
VVGRSKYVMIVRNLIISLPSIHVEQLPKPDALFVGGGSVTALTHK